ncbi:3-hydroxyacyl-ACP dehydratase FabZ family protein [Paractinoplanes lichenicola]|uniref:Beta-hydroxyacyl-ACP dehydratase n=1 Tax=Paractinoplanes lichenicola TaxID=2802976 RepID=A0ABS1VGE6_9ACTN|nr:3-hydroxyacyl-ACP dehydratase FabZ family protein [Actinoplanes lichenicola]MBL7253395.1 beta-hydroxyacyl-ACP dehydratase [Actinoplanes lichenicola]
MPASSRTATVFDALGHPPRTEPSAEGTRVTLRLPVTRAIPQLAGHYPGFPILPGVLLIDSVRQAAGFACGAELRLCGIDRARFALPLLPGDELELSLVVTPAADGRVAVRARGTRSDGQTAAELSATLEPVVADA